MRVVNSKNILRIGQKSTIWFKIVVLTFATLVPALVSQNVSAAQLTARSVTISTSVAEATNVSYDFEFSWTEATEVQGIIFEFCTTPLGSCTLPPDMVVAHGTVSLGTGGEAPSGFPGTGTFSEVTTNTNSCNAVATNMYCINRTEGALAAGSGATVNLNDIINPSLASNYLTVYIRISLFDNSTFSGGAVHDGTVAAGITTQLTTAGRVQERLEFCVAAIGDEAVLPNGCNDGVNFPSTTNIDLGVIDNTSVVVSPVDNTPTNGANDMFGIAVVNTNASGGVSLSYFPEEAVTVSGGDTDQLRAFRVLPADCSSDDTSTTDQCFISADPAGTNFGTGGSEGFGLYVACVNDTQGSTANFKQANGGILNAAYGGDDGGDMDDTGADCENEANATFAFQDNGSPATLITSNNVIDDEIVKIRFGATASPTTPTGTYVVVTTYIATPTF